jgi:hypothetical protein
MCFTKDHSRQYNATVVEQWRGGVKKEPTKRLLRSRKNTGYREQEWVETEESHDNHSVMQLRGPQLWRHNVMDKWFGKHKYHHCNYHHNDAQNGR